MERVIVSDLARHSAFLVLIQDLCLQSSVCMRQGFHYETFIHSDFANYVSLVVPEKSEPGATIVIIFVRARSGVPYVSDFIFLLCFYRLST